MSLRLAALVGFQVSASQTRASQTDAVTTDFPFGLNSAAQTASLLCIGSPLGFPLAASQSRAVPSFEAVTIRLPSGLNCAEKMRAKCCIGAEAAASAKAND